MRIMKGLFIALLALILIWGLEKLYSNLGGSYPVVGTWELEVAENDIVEIIRGIKKEDPSLDPPELKGYYKKNSEGFGFWLYYGDTKETVSFQIASTKNDEVRVLSLIHISDSNTVYKSFNGGFGYYETWRQLNRFENRVVDRIKSKLEQKKQHMISE